MSIVRHRRLFCCLAARSSVAVLLLLLAASTLAAEDPNWSGWRGPTRDGQDSGRPWPSRISGGALQLVWRVAMGPSYSGPVTAGDLVFVTETHDKRQEVVRGLSIATGEERWRTQWEGAMTVPFFAAENGSWIRSTPATDGDNLFVAGMRDLLVCLEAKTGRERWRFDFVERFKTELPSFGFVCSPLLDADHVYVQAGAATVKLAKKDGALAWRTLDDGGGMFGSAFSSPTFAELGGKRHLLVQTRTHLAGVDPADGKVLWKQEVPAFRGMNIVTPIVHGQRVFTSSYGGATFGFDVARDGDGWTVKEAWKEKTQGYMSTPVVHGAHVYMHLKNQRLACFDLLSGSKSWTSPQPYGKYMSLAIQGDRILALDERGILFLLRANPRELEQLDSFQVSEQPTWAHVAIAAGHLIIRELGACAVYRWTEPSESAEQRGPMRL